MARVRDVPCSGGCGQLIWRGKGCLPPGQSMCQKCRRARRSAVQGAADCVQCGAPIRLGVESYQRKTCSTDCFKAWRAEHAKAIGAANLKHDPNRTCEVCGEAYRRTYPPQRTCSRRCGAELKLRTARQAICKTCGKTTAVYTTGSLPRWCSDACKPKPIVTPVVKDCAVCSGSFEGSGKFCPGACRAEAKRRYEADYNANRRPRPAGWDRSNRQCPECFEQFAPDSVGKLYCDSTCAGRASRRRERAAGTRSGETHRSRARRFGRKYEPVRPLTVFERDRWRCRLCGKKVPKDKVAPHPLAPTLDHIIPMSRPGGDHVYANVQLAHFLCNSKKGARGGPEQLLLIG